MPLGRMKRISFLTIVDLLDQEELSSGLSPLRNRYSYLGLWNSAGARERFEKSESMPGASVPALINSGVGVSGRGICTVTVYLMCTYGRYCCRRDGEGIGPGMHSVKFVVNSSFN